MRFSQLLESAFYCYLYFTSGFILCVMETSHLQEMHIHSHFYPVFDEQHSVISKKKNKKNTPSLPPTPTPTTCFTGVLPHFFSKRSKKKFLDHKVKFLHLSVFLFMHLFRVFSGTACRNFLLFCMKLKRSS